MKMFKNGSARLPFLYVHHALHHGGTAECYCQANICGQVATETPGPQGVFRKCLSKYFSQECLPYNPAL
jgi:hypothetical protein